MLPASEELDQVAADGITEDVEGVHSTSISFFTYISQ
jgi:hypothetical protein